MTTKAEQFVASVTTQDSNAIYAALEAAAALGDVKEDQDWEAGKSTWTFDDLSAIVMEGSEWRITSRPDSRYTGA